MALQGSWWFALPLVLLVGCAGGAGGGLSGDPVDITIQGQFEKRDLGTSGFASGLAVQPTRHAYVEVIEEATQGVLVAGYLDADGRGIASIPADGVVYLALYADYQVPNLPEDASFFMNGSVKRASTSASYASTNAFNSLPEWAVTSDSFAVDQSGTLTLTALENTREAGAFNIADQGVAFASCLRDLDPSLRLPDLHAFWNPDDPSAPTTYPEVAVDDQGYLLRQTQAMGGRDIFQTQIRQRAVPGSVAGDAYADGALQENFAHLLFADYSAGGAPILRRDNDPAPVDRDHPSESAIAFVGGYCDFLSGAIRNSRSITHLDSGGSPVTFYLDDPAYPKIGSGGEFYRGSVAIHLYTGWKQVLGGGTTGLGTLWQATQASYPGEYLQAPLGCYPTYLTGVKGLLGASSPSWQALVARMDTDVTAPTYLNGSALWIRKASLPFTESGALRTYASTYYYDRDQSQAYRFTLSAAGSLNLQLLPTGGQDFFLELIGPTGIVAASTDYLGGALTRTLSLSSLPAGDYVARVRAGYTTANNPAAGYTLSVQ